jgi:dihydrofolate reductase
LRKLTLNLYTTLDGRAEFPPYPGSDAPSKKADPAFIEMWIDRYDSVDTLLFGRRAFEMQLTVWPSSKRTPSDPKFMHEYSRWKDNVQKIVFSHKLKETSWANTKFVEGDIGRFVRRLKEQPGKDIILEGGPSFAQEFIRRGLVDDYRFLVFPVILGRGKDWFGSLLKQETMRLMSSRTLKDGELVLHHEKVR